MKKKYFFLELNSWTYILIYLVIFVYIFWNVWLKHTYILRLQNKKIVQLEIMYTLEHIQNRLFCYTKIRFTWSKAVMRVRIFSALALLVLSNLNNSFFYIKCVRTYFYVFSHVLQKFLPRLPLTMDISLFKENCRTSDVSYYFYIIFNLQ